MGSSWAARQLTQQLHESAPVCQVKDSEDDATKPARKKQTARKSTRKGKVLPNYYPFGCPECFLHTCTQEELDLHRQQDHNVAPVHQIKDSEEAAAYKEQVKANRLARRRKQKVQASTTQDLAREEAVVKSGNTAPVLRNGNTITA